MQEWESWEHEKCETDGCQMRFNPDMADTVATDDAGGRLTGWYLPSFVTDAQREASDNLPAHDCTIDGVMH